MSLLLQVDKNHFDAKNRLTEILGTATTNTAFGRFSKWIMLTEVNISLHFVHPYNTTIYTATGLLSLLQQV